MGSLYTAIRDKDEVSFDDLQVVLPLVLRHRVDLPALSEILKDLELRRVAGTRVKPPPPPTDSGSQDENRPPSPPEENGQATKADGSKDILD